MQNKKKVLQDDFESESDIPKLSFPRFSDFAISRKPEKPQSLPALPALPKLPSSNLSDDLTRDAIKSKLSFDDAYSASDLEEIPKSEEKPAYLGEVEEDIPEIQTQEPEIPEIPKPSYVKKEAVEDKSKEIFVKIQDYKQAIASFNDIKSKLQEVEGLMLGIKETKKREEIELDSWKQEIDNLKNNIENIERKLFKK